jgi:hypothetical protein
VGVAAIPCGGALWTRIRPCDACGSPEAGLDGGFLLATRDMIGMEALPVSNRRILSNLEGDLDRYRSGQFTRDQIASRLRAHVNALEGVPYSVVLEARSLGTALEMDGIYADDEEESHAVDPVDQVREWAARLKELYP